jgi:HD-GYP domain-containing protein (c-di-GMP phosphodiesterase class II)
MVRSHHERWDGHGYPDGLGGEEIPLGSRIIMVSDTIDAMTTDRPYRDAMTLDRVISELQRCSGTQFDPHLVEVVLSSLAVRRLMAEQSGQQLPPALQDMDTPGGSQRVAKSPALFRKSGL